MNRLVSKSGHQMLRSHCTTSRVLIPDESHDGGDALERVFTTGLNIQAQLLGGNTHPTLMLMHELGNTMRLSSQATSAASCVHCHFALIAVCSLFSLTGCQLAKRPGGFGNASKTSFKPMGISLWGGSDIENTDKSESLTQFGGESGVPASDTMTVRGQSSNGQYRPAAFGSDPLSLSASQPTPPAGAETLVTPPLPTNAFTGFPQPPIAQTATQTTTPAAGVDVPDFGGPSIQTKGIQSSGIQGSAIQGSAIQGAGVQPSATTQPNAQSSALPPPASYYGGSQQGTGPLSTPGDYGSTLAPGVNDVPYSSGSAVAPGASPAFDPYAGLEQSNVNAYQPQERIAPIDVYVQEARTGRVILGGAVNSDLGVSGQLIIDERNFDIWRIPRSWDELWSGRAFRGGGQNFRAEIMPGSQVQRYTINWTEPHFRDLPYSLSVGGFLYTRQFRDWTEQRLGGRVALGYEVTKDLSVSTEMRMEDVKLFDPRLSGVSELDDALGSNDIYRARFRLAHDTRDNPFMSSEGGLVELIFDQVFGEYDYSRAQVNLNRYFLMRERADGGGRHTLASTMKFGVTGSQTPIFENFFAGGYSTMRGFSFRGASPKVGDVQVGGEFMFLGSLEYVFPLTADEMLRGVAFVDYGTVESDLTLNSENFRVAPGLGFRIAVPALGPAPLAFDFAVPINYADTDDRQVFSFFMGLTRS